MFAAVVAPDLTATRLKGATKFGLMIARWGRFFLGGVDLPTGDVIKAQPRSDFILPAIFRAPRMVAGKGGTL